MIVSPSTSGSGCNPITCMNGAPTGHSAESLACGTPKKTSKFHQFTKRLLELWPVLRSAA